ncbi:MAG: GGDEF domain-containing protein [Desulfovibrionaceae bacterium]|nr:GGDEF domain-containing protein [Desulfovibrionaceae bacterium]
MTSTIKSRSRKTAWRIFNFQSAASVAVIAAAVFPVLLLADRRLALASILAASAVVLGLSLLAATRYMRLLEGCHDKIATLTTHDDLTGLPNRRWFFDRLDEEVDRAGRYGNDLSMIMIDLDHFKRGNSEFGHPLGDQALAEVARLIAANVRASDVVARYGGEEFVVLLPETTAERASLAAEKLRIVVEVNDISLEGPQVKVTVSCGVAGIGAAPKEGKLRDNLILAADKALSRAKENGRNQVIEFTG